MDNSYYVYEHWRPDRDICFYVGKGKTRRAAVMYSRGQHHENIQKKLARLGMCVEVRMVASGLTENEAYALERERIAFWKEVGVVLCNRSDGGDGGGSNPSQETRALMRAAKLGKPQSEEHKQKVAEKMRSVLADPLVKEKLSAASRAYHSRPEVKEAKSKFFKELPRTEEHRRKISEALTGRKLSTDHAEKARKASLGRKQSQEEINKRRASNTGKKRSDESKQRMASAWTPERKAAQALRTAAMNKARAKVSTEGK